MTIEIDGTIASSTPRATWAAVDARADESLRQPRDEAVLSRGFDDAGVSAGSGVVVGRTRGFGRASPLE
jgi:hypothetical protein